MAKEKHDETTDAIGASACIRFVCPLCYLVLAVVEDAADVADGDLRRCVGGVDGCEQKERECGDEAHEMGTMADSRNDPTHHIAIDIREAEVAAGVAVGELFVIKAELMQDGGVQIVDVDFVFLGVHA